MNYTSSPLLTDFYQLTMMQSYFDNEMHDEAVFELFFRKLPSERQFLLACGLEQVLDYLEHLRFTDEDIAFLGQDGRFHEKFLKQLRGFKFTGSVHAIPEGTPVFPDEPLIRITAPLAQAQLVETRIINILHFQTMIASKAARIRRVMPGKIFVDYGLRRSHGGEAGVMAARGSYLAGFDGTATVIAGKEFGIPLYGTMAHSFIQAHQSEHDAFTHFATSHPNNTVILLDTYDTEEATRKVITLAAELKEKNIHIRGVRLDSGDMIQLSRRVRELLDSGGLSDVLIFASGNLDEYTLQQFREENAPVDGFGVGSKLTTSTDVPYFDCAYKLVEYAGFGRRKLATGKSTWPGRKQVFRNFKDDGQMAGDILALEDEKLSGIPLIQQYMENGVRTQKLPQLSESRHYSLQQLEALPPLPANRKVGYPVQPSPELQAYSEDVTKRMKRDNR